MTTTISRVREHRGQRTRVRERVPDDSTAPKRRRFKASGTFADLLTTDTARRRPRATTKTRLVRGKRARTASDVAPPPPRGDSIATRLAKTARGTRSRRSGSDREKAKLASIRDGRYAPGRARFVV